ncbi:hypothetical protein [Paenibacillus sp. FSL R7-0652]|uniref:hypothetical protein n=1 Tax=Paenibacillus sp. FSL R7-0652 TaxID=2921687 RepID=UPI003159AA5A
MGEVWTSSMQGTPWTIRKMNKAVKQLGHRALVSFVIDIDKLEDLQALDKHVFAKRPDLILSVHQIDMKGCYTEELLQTIAGLKHITALQLKLYHPIDLSILGKLEQLQFLSITSNKPVNLEFLSNFRNLQYLSLHGTFVDLAPIEDAAELDTLILSTNFHELNFIRHLNQLECLFIHDCTLKGSLEGLADSNVKMLSLANIRNLTDLNDITSMHNLIYLRLSLPKVEALCDFSKMNNLRQLEMDHMKALKHIDQLWSAPRLEMLQLRQISTSIKAEDLEPLTEMKHLQQLDFRFIDFNKGRIAALRSWFNQAGKDHILYENIAEDKRMKSMWLIHLQKHLG